MTEMTTVDVVKKLVGPINPIGDSGEDARRYENIVHMSKVIEELVREMEYVVHSNRHAYEGSVRKSADFAEKFLKDDLQIKIELR